MTTELRSTTERSTSNPTFVSFFAGVGGFDMGVESAGFDCVAQVEWDDHCQTVLARHWPDVPRWGDIQTVSGYEIPPADLVIFGSPCQDLSVAGKRQGLDGGRSSMFYEATRVIKEMRDGTDGTLPRVVVWENVAGALFSNGGADFGKVLDEMADLGALVIEWAVLDARYFGVPQRRRRIFLVAIFDPALADRCPEQLLPLGESSHRNHSSGRISGSLSSSDVTDPDLAASGAIAFDYNFGGLARFQFEVSPPVKIGSAQGIASPPAITRSGEPPRKLLPIECERLMGWPDDHTLYRADGTEVSDAQRYKMCGNGVASPVAEWVARQIRPLLDL